MLMLLFLVLVAWLAPSMLLAVGGVLGGMWPYFLGMFLLGGLAGVVKHTLDKH
jgi:hypothetical protein